MIFDQHPKHILKLFKYFYFIFNNKKILEYLTQHFCFYLYHIYFNEDKFNYSIL